jgi:uncharacterized membrane protein
VFGAIYLGQATLVLWSLTRVRRFLESTPVIADELGLTRYKAFVRVQMYCALAPLVLMPPGLALTLLVVVRHGALGLVVVLAVNAFLFALARTHKRLEARARSLETGSESLQQEYRRISNTWLNKALPDF